MTQSSSRDPRAGSGQFVASDTGIRDVALTDTSPWLRRLRFLPLGLVCAGAVASLAVQPFITQVPANQAQVTAQVQEQTAHTWPLSCSPHRDESLEVTGPWSDPAQAAAAQERVTDELGDPAPVAVEGQDSMIFWGDVQAQNFAQGLGSVLPDEGRDAAWLNYLGAIQASAYEHNAQVFFLVAPAKWDVYRDRLPEWTDDLQGTLLLDRMIAAYPQLPWVDVRGTLQQLREREPDVPLYSRVNSHWSPYAATAAWEQIADCLEAVSGEHSERMPVTGVTLQAAGNEFAEFGYADPDAPDWAVPVTDAAETVHVTYNWPDADPAEVDQPVTDAVDFGAIPATVTNPAAANQSRVLFVRDSQGNSLSPAINHAFGTVEHVGHAIGSGATTNIPQLIAQTQPRIVLVEITERYLSLAP